MFKANAKFDEIKVGDIIEEATTHSEGTVDTRRGEVARITYESWGDGTARDLGGRILASETASIVSRVVNILERPEVVLPKEEGSIIAVKKLVLMRQPSMFPPYTCWRSPGSLDSLNDEKVKDMIDSRDDLVVYREGYGDV